MFCYNRDLISVYYGIFFYKIYQKYEENTENYDKKNVYTKGIII